MPRTYITHTHSRVFFNGLLVIYTAGSHARLPSGWNDVSLVVDARARTPDIDACEYHGYRELFIPIIHVSNVHLLDWESRCNNVIYTDHVAVTLRRAMINSSTDLRDEDYN